MFQPYKRSRRCGIRKYSAIYASLASVKTLLQLYYNIFFVPCWDTSNLLRLILFFLKCNVTYPNIVCFISALFLYLRKRKCSTLMFTFYLCFTDNIVSSIIQWKRSLKWCGYLKHLHSGVLDGILAIQLFVINLFPWCYALNFVQKKGKWLGVYRIFVYLYLIFVRASSSFPYYETVLIC